MTRDSSREQATERDYLRSENDGSMSWVLEFSFYLLSSFWKKGSLLNEFISDLSLAWCCFLLSLLRALFSGAGSVFWKWSLTSWALAALRQNLWIVASCANLAAGLLVGLFCSCLKNWSVAAKLFFSRNISILLWISIWIYIRNDYFNHSVWAHNQPDSRPDMSPAPRPDMRPHLTWLIIKS